MMKFLIKSYYTPMPSNLYYWWNFGSLLGLCLVLQILTGLFLSMFYENSMLFTFSSISQIERNINMGWFIRSMHSNGASLFFFCIYLHTGRGLYFKSFYLQTVWLSGTLMLLTLFMTAFLGYVLPWGQMSFWGATVITNLLSATPYVGSSLTIWLWGSFAVSKPTLMRFFCLHFMLPFFLLSLALLHIFFLHQKSSSNPLGPNSNIDKIPFHPYFTWKDLTSALITLCIFLSLVLIFPYSLMDPDNFMPANPLSTPPHIQPEWYFLFAYAILRTIPNKLGGVLALIFSIVILMLLSLIPSLDLKKYTSNNKMIFKILFFLWMNNFMFLTLMGASSVEIPFIFLTKFSSMLYFSFFLIYL